MKRFGLHLAALVAMLGSAQVASAQNIDRAFQLGLGTNFLQYTSGSIDTDAYDADVSQTTWGISDHGGIQLEGGYALNDSLVLGGIVALGGQTVSIDDSDQDVFQLVLAPKLDYMFLSGERFRPFVGGAIGLVSTSQEVNGGAKLSETGLGLMARGGGRWFLAPGFSLDPALNLGFQTLSGEIDGGAVDMDASMTAFTVGLSIGLSGWVR
ncbi:MAG: outer membrane beta-barrel protein [Polyangiaceae bacterium]